jgi:hypothetical protein
MAETRKDPQPCPAADTTGKGPAPGHRIDHPEQVSEEGQDTQKDPRPTREKLSGTPLGSDPRE